MKIENKKVVGIEYTLKDRAGAVIDSNSGADPLYFIQGMGTIVPGLERAMNDKAAGESFDVEIKAAEGYGEYDSTRKRGIPRESVPHLSEAKPGMMLQAQGPEGASVVTVAEVTDKEIVIDGNHPMAGKDLFFSIRIAEVREATEDELSHGHVHGPGEHHH